MEKYAPATANKMLSALRRVLKEALRLELMDARDFERAVDITNIKVSKELQGRCLTEGEVNALMQVCFADPTPIGYRDAALIAILRGAGLRRGEVVKLLLSDFHAGNNIKVRGGKGGKDRTVYLPDGALSIVEDWLEIRRLEAGALICHINRGGAITRRQLTSQAVLFILQKRGKEAGVENFSAHDFRRTFISGLLDNTDIVTVQKLAGHASPELTSRYDRRGEETKRQAVQSISVPKRSR